MKWFGILLMAALLASAPGYGSAQQTKDTSPAAQPQGAAIKAEAAGTAKSFTAAEKKAYEKKTAEELDAIQQKIGGLRMQAASGAPQQKRVRSRAANNLQLQETTARSELAALEKAPESAWGAQKVKLDKTMAGLRQAFEPTPSQGK
jgi:hypothetical protein